jgi:NAD(P)H-flavin reductase
MASPVIDSTSPESAALSPGQFVDVTVVAHDPDSASGSVQFPISDSAGNQALAAISLVVDDPLTFGVAENPDGLAVTVTGPTIGVDPATGHPSGTYRITAA